MQQYQSQHPESSRIAVEPKAQDSSRTHLGGQPGQDGHGGDAPFPHAAHGGGASDNGRQSNELHGGHKELNGVQDGHLSRARGVDLVGRWVGGWVSGSLLDSLLHSLLLVGPPKNVWGCAIYGAGNRSNRGRTLRSFMLLHCVYPRYNKSSDNGPCDCAQMSSHIFHVWHQACIVGLW